MVTKFGGSVNKNIVQTESPLMVQRNSRNSSYFVNYLNQEKETKKISKDIHLMPQVQILGDLMSRAEGKTKIEVPFT